MLSGTKFFGSCHPAVPEPEKKPSDFSMHRLAVHCDFHELARQTPRIILAGSALFLIFNWGLRYACCVMSYTQVSPRGRQLRSRSAATFLLVGFVTAMRLKPPKNLLFARKQLDFRRRNFLNAIPPAREPPQAFRILLRISAGKPPQRSAQDVRSRKSLGSAA